MPGFIIAIASALGISPLRLIAYGAIALTVVVGAASIRRHYINLGWEKAITAVKKQDARSKAAADEVERRANDCSANSFWDVVTRSCKVDQ